MRAADARILISRDAQKQILLQELLNKGITETKEGQRVDELDYHSLKHEVTIARIRETNIEIEANRWF